ncbi:MAG: methyltransferase [Candidatus Micrarchaeaceae archaeon]
MHRLELCGILLNTSPEVYEPAEDTLLTIEALSKCLGSFEKAQSSGLRVLDMGTGTGIIGLFAARSRAVADVLLADKSSEAVAIARSNAALNVKLCRKCRVIRSNLFDAISGRFEIIVMNAPYLRHEPGEPEREAEMLSGGDEGIELSVAFLSAAKRHLSSHGVVLLSASSLSNQDKLLRHAATEGYVIKEKASMHLFFEDIIVYTFALGSTDGNARGK